MKNLFSTSDLSLCVVLCYFGCKIEGIDKINPLRVQFYFKRENDLDKLIEGFWKKELLVEPIAFFSLIKEIKNLIYIKE
ncbi:MAG: DUF5659 domain-containing protein [Patescibacteria group bacterium]|nr:DUF5659 domain-containing protein [Patescibacteria group bacterium]MDD4303926.1 DUF5659 domain-containing protein [Patescibacteria group bacterium]MDD4695086.1 DUF5659 domain-containing protein [Patescibacteria group bacterium]